MSESQSLSYEEKMEKEYQLRSIPIPPQRQGAIKRDWTRICMSIVEQCGLHIRMNLKTKAVDIRTCEATKDASLLERGALFIRAIILGFGVEDALVVIKMGDVFLDSFDIKDVKKLKNDHLDRAIGRIIGKDGKVKKAIETSSKTRIVVDDTDIHILGSVENIRVAKDSVCRLIQGSQPGKICNRVRVISSKLRGVYGTLETVTHNFN
jgi:RNA-binding protein PNO1